LKTATFWMPSIIKSTGITNSLHMGFLTAIPYAVAVVAILLNARHSNCKNRDHIREAGDGMKGQGLHFSV